MSRSESFLWVDAYGHAMLGVRKNSARWWLYFQLRVALLEDVCRKGEL